MEKKKKSTNLYMYILVVLAIIMSGATFTMAFRNSRRRANTYTLTIDNVSLSDSTRLSFDLGNDDIDCGYNMISAGKGNQLRVVTSSDTADMYIRVKINYVYDIPEKYSTLLTSSDRLQITDALKVMSNDISSSVASNGQSVFMRDGDYYYVVNTAMSYLYPVTSSSTLHLIDSYTISSTNQMASAIATLCKYDGLIEVNLNLEVQAIQKENFSESTDKYSNQYDIYKVFDRYSDVFQSYTYDPFSYTYNGNYTYTITGIESGYSRKYIKIPDSVTINGVKGNVIAFNYTGSNSLFTNTTTEFVELNKYIDTIPSNIFYDCDHIVGIALPQNVTTIGENAFSNCNNLSLFYTTNKISFDSTKEIIAKEQGVADTIRDIYVTSVQGGTDLFVTHLTGLGYEIQELGLETKQYTYDRYHLGAMTYTIQLRDFDFTGVSYTDSTHTNDTTQNLMTGNIDSTNNTTGYVFNATFTVPSTIPTLYYGSTDVGVFCIWESEDGQGYLPGDTLKVTKNMILRPRFCGRYDVSSYTSDTFTYTNFTNFDALTSLFTFTSASSSTSIPYTREGEDFRLYTIPQASKTSIYGEWYFPANITRVNNNFGYSSSSANNLCNNMTKVVMTGLVYTTNYLFGYLPNLTTAILPKYEGTLTSTFKSCERLVSAFLPKVTGLASNGDSGVFANCTSLESVVLSDCTTVGRSSFYYCSSLQSISLPSCTFIDQYAFYYSSQLATISLPNCLTINYYSFQGCTSITSIDFPELTTIHYNAFKNCTSLTSVSLPKCTSVVSSSYSSTDYGAFYGCTDLTTVSMPLCENTGKCTFGNCTALTQISLPLCETINDFAFIGCSELLTVTIVNATSIGERAFDHCSKLATVNFPEVTSVASGAFCNCSLLTEISLPACETIADHKNSNSYGAFRYCSELVTVNLPSCTYVGSYAFYDDKKVANVTLPLCEEIGQAAFCYCSAITTLSLPVCTVIGQSGLQETGLTSVYLPVCEELKSQAITRTKLTTISLPECVTVGGTAFHQNNNLVSAYIPKCETLSYNAFKECSKLKTVQLTSCTSTGSSSLPSGIKTLYIGTEDWAQTLINSANYGGINQYSSVSSLDVLYVKDDMDISYINNLKTGKYVQVPNDLQDEPGYIKFVTTGSSKVKYSKGLAPSVSNLPADAGFTGTSYTINTTVPTSNNYLFACWSAKVEMSGSPNTITDIGYFKGGDTITISDSANLVALYLTAMWAGVYSGENNATFRNFRDLVLTDNYFTLTKVDGTAITSSNYNNMTESDTIILSAGSNTCATQGLLFIPNVVDTITNNALQGTGFAKIVVSSDLNGIGNSAFAGCTNLTEIVLRNVGMTGDNIFNGCTALTDIYFTNIINMSSNTFNGIPNACKINSVSTISVTGYSTSSTTTKNGKTYNIYQK